MIRILSIAWGVLFNLAEAIVIFAMFNILTSPFETIVVSALVIIYVSVIRSFSILGNALLQKGHQDFYRFIEIAKSLNLNTALYEEALNEDKEKFQRGQLSYRIDVVFRATFLLFAIVNLLYGAYPEFCV